MRLSWKKAIEKGWRRSFNIGKRSGVVAVAVSSDGFWDWRSENHVDTHRDVIAFVLHRRAGTNAQGVRLTIGPLYLGVLIGQEDDDARPVRRAESWHFQDAKKCTICGVEGAPIGALHCAFGRHESERVSEEAGIDDVGWAFAVTHKAHPVFETTKAKDGASP